MTYYDALFYDICHNVYMTIWVSKEASRAQEYSHEKIKAANNDF